MKEDLKIGIRDLKNKNPNMEYSVLKYRQVAKKVLNNKDLCSKARNKTLVKLANEYLNLEADSKYASKPKVIKKKKNN